MNTIRLVMLLPAALRRGAASSLARRASILPILAVLSTVGCALPPGLQSLTYQGHQINRDQAPPGGQAAQGGPPASQSPQAIPQTTQVAPQSAISEKQREHAELLAAQQRFQRKDFKGSGELLQDILARDPRNCEARLLMAVALLSTQQEQAALAQLQEGLKYHAEDPDLQYAMGVTLDANGRPDEALAYYERATRTAPKNEAYSQGYRLAQEAATRRKAEVGIGRDGTKLAADASRAPQVVPVSAIAVSKDRSAEFLQRGEEALENGSPTMAADFFRQAAAGDPGNPQIPIMAATCALKHNEARMAAEILASAARSFPRSAAVFRCLAIAHLRMQDFAAAKVDSEQAIALDKSSALAYYTLGCTLTNLGQREAADSNFRQAAALDPRYAARQ
jgi:Tfp pilus assembly protein PilF